jgi:hypothetical protein
MSREPEADWKSLVWTKSQALKPAQHWVRVSLCMEWSQGSGGLAVSLVRGHGL